MTPIEKLLLDIEQVFRTFPSISHPTPEAAAWHVFQLVKEARIISITNNSSPPIYRPYERGIPF